ncbi:unnamed protein product [Symbiodinium natans]|uniref:Uncharacterized protein n=1 Tax=Symbiodinium natans TaxID=878477 RepID=A0A812I9F3_9DINO|nr:unnamed protein product [Symbiodinium natans]
MEAFAPGATVIHSVSQKVHKVGDDRRLLCRARVAEQMLRLLEVPETMSSSEETAMEPVQEEEPLPGGAGYERVRGVQLEQQRRGPNPRVPPVSFGTTLQGLGRSYSGIVLKPAEPTEPGKKRAKTEPVPWGVLPAMVRAELQRGIPIHLAGKSVAALSPTTRAVAQTGIAEHEVNVVRPEFTIGKAMFSHQKLGELPKQVPAFLISRSDTLAQTVTVELDHSFMQIAFCSSQRTARTSRTTAAMSRPPATSRKVGRVVVLLALFLVCLPEPKTSALNSVRSVPEQLQASNADGAGFAWSGGRAVFEVGCDVWHGVPKMRKPERGDDRGVLAGEGFTVLASFDQAVKAASAQTADPVEDAKQADEQLQQTVQETEEIKQDEGFDESTEKVANARKFLELALARWVGAEEDLKEARAARAFAFEQFREAVRNGDEDEKRTWEQERKEAKAEFEKAKAEFDEAKEEARKAREELEKAKSTAPLQVCGQFSFASGWTLQAKAAPRVIKEEALGPLSQARVPAAKLQDGQRLVGIDACVKACMGLIEKYINRSDVSVTNRVPPTCAARCARGGKTTFLLKLGERLAEAEYLPIFVSFNGESPVKRRDNELADEWLYRTIAYALLPANSSLRQDVADELGNKTCQKSTLQSYFECQKNVVLLVDELNQLLLRGPTQEEKNAEQDAARFMKNVFLGSEGAYMVFTSHIQSTGLDLTQYMEGDSVRGLEITGLPFADELGELQNMSPAFSGLTHMKAAYYSRVPALLWSSHDDGSLLSQKFSQIRDDPQQHLAAFLREVFAGTPMREMEAFRQLTDGSQKDRPIWIPCFMSHFLTQCSSACPACGVLGRWLQGMQAAEEKDGKAWEKIIAVAFGLRYIWQQMGGEEHGWLHGHEGAAIQCLDANPAAKTVEQAMQQLPQPLQYPTLQLVLPSHAQFEAVDLFAVRRKADSADLVMVAQQKEGSASVNHPRPQTAKHAYWMRGSSTQNAKTKDGWILPSQSEIEKFLGPSLAAAAPATWRDPVD